MSNIKITVYAICKNESQFVERWYNSVKEADYIYVMDTGSTDDTVKKLKDLGVVVKTETISPWRFDNARNASMNNLPEDTDIYVCLDLDEIILPGWANELRKSLKPQTDRFSYKYVWSYEEDGSEGIVFNSEKIHTKGYEWINPVHEILRRKDRNRSDIRQLVNIEVRHYPDNTKSRSDYLPLLELAITEDPENDRNMHYLAREYFFNRRYEEAINTFEKHLSLKSSVWKAERAASMRYIAKCFLGMGDQQAAELWFLRAIMESPYRREPYTDLASIYYFKSDWRYVIKYAEAALNIKEKPLDYLCEPKSWGPYLNDVLCLAYYNLGNIKKSLENAQYALALDPNNPRLKQNVALLEGF